MSAALMAACELVFLSCFRETYKVIILRRKAARLSKETGNTFKTIYDVDESKRNSTSTFLESITRPFIVFFGSSVLQALSLFGGMTFTYFYIMSTTLPDIVSFFLSQIPVRLGLTTTRALVKILTQRRIVQCDASHFGSTGLPCPSLFSPRAPSQAVFP